MSALDNLPFSLTVDVFFGRPLTAYLLSGQPAYQSEDIILDTLFSSRKNKLDCARY